MLSAFDDAALELKRSKPWTGKPNFFAQLEALEKLYHVLDKGRGLFPINKVAKHYSDLTQGSDMSTKGVWPEPQDIFAWYWCAYSVQSDEVFETLQKLSEKVTGQSLEKDLKKFAAEWDRARRLSEQSGKELKKLWELKDSESERLLEKTRESEEAIEKDLKCLHKLMRAIQPEARPFPEDAKDRLDLKKECASLRGSLFEILETARRGLEPDGHRVREARARRNWSQGDLSKETAPKGDIPKVSVRTIARIEGGERADKKTLEAVCKALGVPLEQVLKNPEEQ